MLPSLHSVLLEVDVPAEVRFETGLVTTGYSLLPKACGRLNERVMLYYPSVPMPAILTTRSVWVAACTPRAHANSARNPT